MPFLPKDLKRGFTLIEALVVLGIFSLLVAVSAPFYQSFQARNDIDVAANTIIQALTRAQGLSRAVKGDSAWGVRIQPGVITLFQGNNFSSPDRDKSNDEIFKMPKTITPSGANEIVYAKFTGYPVSTGTVTIAIPVKTVNIAVNQKGLVEY
jgi:prepilin-type N-terminal cleavage/methylation domain-containing protein